jgi:hypothetical protein
MTSAAITESTVQWLLHRRRDIETAKALSLMLGSAARLECSGARTVCGAISTCLAHG